MGCVKEHSDWLYEKSQECVTVAHRFLPLTGANTIPIRVVRSFADKTRTGSPDPHLMDRMLTSCPLLVSNPPSKYASPALSHVSTTHPRHCNPSFSLRPSGHLNHLLGRPTTPSKLQPNSTSNALDALPWATPGPNANPRFVAVPASSMDTSSGPPPLNCDDWAIIVLEPETDPEQFLGDAALIRDFLNNRGFHVRQMSRSTMGAALVQFIDTCSRDTTIDRNPFFVGDSILRVIP